MLERKFRGEAASEANPLYVISACARQECLRVKEEQEGEGEGEEEEETEENRLRV